MLTFEKFMDRVKQVKSYKSVTGRATYSHCAVDGVVLNFIRDNTGKTWQINLPDAYTAYQNEPLINTTVLRSYMRNRVYSPTMGLLIAIELYNRKGQRN